MWVPQPHQGNHQLSVPSPTNLYFAFNCEIFEETYLSHPDDSVGVPVLQLVVDRLSHVRASQGAGDEGALLVGDLQQVEQLLRTISWLPQVVLHVQPLWDASWSCSSVLVAKPQFISNL